MGRSGNADSGDCGGEPQQKRSNPFHGSIPLRRFSRRSFLSGAPD
jgi:hypothetical protein